MRRNRLTSEASEKDIDSTIKRWLYLAPDRDGGRKERQKRKENQEKTSLRTCLYGICNLKECKMLCVLMLKIYSMLISLVLSCFLKCEIINIVQNSHCCDLIWEGFSLAAGLFHVD